MQKPQKQTNQCETCAHYQHIDSAAVKQCKYKMDYGRISRASNKCRLYFKRR